MQAQVDYTNPLNYKRCQKKQYEIYVCKPAPDTVVINKLEQYDVVKQLNGQTAFTVQQLENMQKHNPQKFAFIKQCIASGKVYVVNPNTPFVLAGTLGELWCIDANKLASKYTFVREGYPLQITPQTVNERSQGGLLDWTLVRTVPDRSQAWACFVPSSQKGKVQTAWGAVLGINEPGVSHGKGDFVIAADAGGQPNLNDIYVVNGRIFAKTYNNQGWVGYLDSRYTTHRGRTLASDITIADLPKLITFE